MSKITDKHYNSKLEWRRRNPEKIKEYANKYREKTNEWLKVWRKENKDKTNKAHNKWVNKNKEKVYNNNRIWKENNKEEHLKRRRESQKIRRNSDPLYKFSQNIRLLISNSFRRSVTKFKKRNHSEEILGCSIDEFRKYILSLCPDGVTLEDFGRFGYHIDHKISIDSAETEEEIVKLNHYTNLQPLWWMDNLSKSTKLPEVA